MEFRVLRYFLAIAREGCMTKAASFLHITQPTLSRQMKELEEEIGHPLFIRESHRLSLTAEGMHLRKRAEEITDLVGKTKEEFSSFEKKIAGDVYIGGGETHGMTLIAEVVKEVRQAYPLIRCHLHSGNAETVTERLDKGLLDFGLLIQPTDLDKYHSLRLPEKDIWGVVMPKSSDLAGKKALTKEDLRGKPLICSQQALRKTATGNAFQDWFGEDFENLDIAATYNLVFNAARLAEQGIGYLLTLDKLVDTKNSSLCFRPLCPVLESGLDIVWKKYQIFSPAAQIFLKTLKDKFPSSSQP